MTPSKVDDAAVAGNKAPALEASEPAGNKPITMRGRKRHKCMVCGNIARSRCPFLSCKGCCVKAGNPCQIHVLKAGATGESSQGPAATTTTQGAAISNVVRHNPYDSLRLRTVRPLALLTKKEAFYINSWRFRKLRAYADGVAQSEDDAFDRYMQNTLLLEELFNPNNADESCVQPASEGPLALNSDGSASLLTPEGAIDAAMVSAAVRLRLRSSSKKRDVHRQKLKRIIDRSLQKLQKGGEELDDPPEAEDLYSNNAGFAARRELKRMKVQSAEGKERLRRMEVFSVVMEKLKAVETQEDYDLCVKMYEDNFPHKKAGGGAWNREGVARTEDPWQLESAGVDADARRVAFSPCDASFKARLDSFGVMKQWWEGEATLLDPLVDAPLLADLESL